MQKRRVQSAENTKRLFSLKGNGNHLALKTEKQQNYGSSTLNTSQNQQQNLRGSLKEKNNLFNSSSSNNNILFNDDSVNFEDSRRAAYNVANYYAGPKVRNQSQNNSLDVIRNNNPSSPQSTGQIKRKIIMKRKISAFPQDFFSSTQGDVNNTVGTNDLSYQLRVINKEGKLVERYDNNNINNNINIKLKSNNILRNNTEKLNSSLGSANAAIRKSDIIDVNMKDIFLRGGQKSFSGNSSGNINILGVTGKTYSQTNVVAKSLGGTKKLNSSNTTANQPKAIDQNLILSKEQKDAQQNFKIQTPKFNIFEGISQKANTVSCSQVNYKVQSLNLNDLIKYSNAVNHSEVINPNDLSIQHDYIAPIDTNRSIQSESQNGINKTQQALLNANKLKPPKPVFQQQQKSSNNKLNSQQINSLQKENRCSSAQIDAIQKTACFSDIMNQHGIDSFSKDNLLNGQKEQFSDKNFGSSQNKRNSLQHYTFADMKEGLANQNEDSSKLKQKNSLQKFISQEDKIPAVFRQMLIPKKARPNSHNNQQIQLRDKCNIMNKLKQKLESNTSITLKELDQMFDDSSKQEDNLPQSIQSNKELIIAPPLPRDNQGKNQTLKVNNNIKKLENTLYQINQDPLYNKIYNQSNNYHNTSLNQTKCIVKRRSYSLQKHETSSVPGDQINSTVSHINRDLLQSNTKSQDNLHTSSKKDQNRRDIFEFSFSKMGTKTQERATEKELSQFSVQQKEQIKTDNTYEKMSIMNNTFNPNYFKYQGWCENTQSKQNDVQQSQSYNNKENLYHEGEWQNPLNSSINNNNNQKRLLLGKRMIFDAKPNAQSFNNQLMKIQINQSNNLLNTQTFKFVNK